VILEAFKPGTRAARRLFGHRGHRSDGGRSRSRRKANRAVEEGAGCVLDRSVGRIALAGSPSRINSSNHESNAARVAAMEVYARRNQEIVDEIKQSLAMMREAL